MDTIDLLSQWMMLGPTYFSFKSSRRRLSRTTSYGAEVAEIYYASMLDRAMICCFFELHAIAIEPSEKTHLVVLFSVIWRASPITVRESNEIELVVVHVMKPIIHSSSYIAQYPLDCT